MQLHVGLDDTDSTKGGCTTYIAARLVEKMSKMDAQFIDYPNIVRLNPNIPYKTRGNAAVALRLEIRKELTDPVREAVLEEVEKYSHIGTRGTEPAIVILTGRPNFRIEQFSKRTLCEVLRPHEAMRTIRLARAEAVAYGGDLGLVGALAAIGQTLNGDHTFELVAYRIRKKWGTLRQVDEDSVKRMDRSTFPETFNNYDFRNERILLTPHGPDPVLLGIRGENPRIVKRAFHMLTIREPIDRWVIFRTNHGTDAHLLQTSHNRTARPFTPVVLRGIVSDEPKRIRGGHVFFTLRCKNGNVKCAAFEPTGDFRNLVATLCPGDVVTVFGGVQHRNSSLTINLEKIRIETLSSRVVPENPICPHCSKHMKSVGKGQGYRCKRCSILLRRARKLHLLKQRSIKPGLYLPTPKALRHLTKPLSRYGQEKKVWNRQPPIGKWHDS